MALIYQFPTPITGTTGLNPNFKFMVVGDDLATVTTAGYLTQDQLQGFPLQSTDVIQLLYSYDQYTKSGTFGAFLVEISATGVITLVADEQDIVDLPTVTGNLIQAANTTGTLEDSGIAADLVWKAPVGAAKTTMLAGETGNIGGAGAGPIAISLAGHGITAASFVVASVQSSSNPCSIIATDTTTDQISLTVSANPGASLIVTYAVFI